MLVRKWRFGITENWDCVVVHECIRQGNRRTMMSDSPLKSTTDAIAEAWSAVGPFFPE